MLQFGASEIRRRPALVRGRTQLPLPLFSILFEQDDGTGDVDLLQKDLVKFFEENIESLPEEADTEVDLSHIFIKRERIQHVFKTQKLVPVPSGLFDRQCQANFKFPTDSHTMLRSFLRVLLIMQQREPGQRVGSCSAHPKLLGLGFFHTELQRKFILLGQSVDAIDPRLSDFVGIYSGDAHAFSVHM